MEVDSISVPMPREFIPICLREAPLRNTTSPAFFRRCIWDPKDTRMKRSGLLLQNASVEPHDDFVAHADRGAVRANKV